MDGSCKPRQNAFCQRDYGSTAVRPKCSQSHFLSYLTCWFCKLTKLYCMIFWNIQDLVPGYWLYWVRLHFQRFMLFFFIEKRVSVLSSESRALFTGLTNLFSSKISLKMSPTILFIYLKIIFLPCFQFSVFNKIKGIKTNS